MLLITLNIVFAIICFGIARAALTRGLPFMKVGWTLIDRETQRAGYHYDVERRRTISEAGAYLIAGILWTVGGALSLIAALFFLGEVYALYR